MCHGRTTGIQPMLDSQSTVSIHLPPSTTGQTINDEKPVQVKLVAFYMRTASASADLRGARL